MLMETVIAVALGVAPVNEDGAVQAASADYAVKVGQYSQVVDRRGTTHVRGHDVRGQAYDLVMDKNGYVEASIGERVITFRVQDPA
jgi:hypothetical protein